MPYTYHIDADAQEIEVNFTGHLTGKNILDMLTEVFFHDDWNMSFPHYWDGAAITKLDFGYADFEMIKPIVQAIQLPDDIICGPMAVIVPNRVTYAIVRAAHAAIGRNYKPFGIFRARNDARLWVNHYFATNNFEMRNQRKILWQSA